MFEEHRRVLPVHFGAGGRWEGGAEGGERTEQLMTILARCLLVFLKRISNWGTDSGIAGLIQEPRLLRTGNAPPCFEGISVENLVWRKLRYPSAAAAAARDRISEVGSFDDLVM